MQRPPLAPDPGPQPLGGPSVALALQGGGSLGAYTWGVLDAWLEDGRLDVEGLTGASAGAINAVAFATGFSLGGRDGARERLRDVWETLAHRGARRPTPRGAILRALWRNRSALRSARAFYELTTALASDVPFDPSTMEPLRGALADTLRLDRLGQGGPRVFVNCTDIATGEPEVFEDAQITVDAVCASAAVPLVFEPVTVNGRRYWDGALIGNPAIYPVIYGCHTADVVLVETRSPVSERPVATAGDVLSRSMELAATAGLVREMRTIRFVTQLLREHPRPGLREIRLHRVPAHPDLARVEGARAFRVELSYFHRLREIGREAGRAWLAEKLGG